MDLPRDINLRERQMRPEWMDRPDVDPQAHAVALHALGRVNWLSLSAFPVWWAIRRLAARHQGRELRVLDVACGGGDFAVNLARNAMRSGLKLTVDGCDLSETAVQTARDRAAQAKVDCHYFQFNVLQDPWPTDYDVICSSLFLHHLTTADAEQVLSRMGQVSRHMVLVNDLVRSRLGYFLARYVSHLITRSPIVHYDGPISVAGAFTPRELRGMAQRAGLAGATVRRHFAERMLLQWIRP